MTDEMMILRSIGEKHSDADLSRHMIAFAAERLMEIEVGALTGGAQGFFSRKVKGLAFVGKKDKAL